MISPHGAKFELAVFKLRKFTSWYLDGFFLALFIDLTKPGNKI